MTVGAYIKTAEDIAPDIIYINFKKLSYQRLILRKMIDDVIQHIIKLTIEIAA